MTHILFLIAALTAFLSIVIFVFYRLKRSRTLGSPAPSDKPVSKAPATLYQGLQKTRGGFVAKLSTLLDTNGTTNIALDDIEETLLTADIGPRTAIKLFEALKDKLSTSEMKDKEVIWNTLREISQDMLAVDTKEIDFHGNTPFVILMVGVNGVGKTTSIGKLATHFTKKGKKVLLAAGDTFRAAASEQLHIWGKRTGAPVVSGSPDADPSSVIFTAIQQGIQEKYDIIIADTAGRLHTQTGLMDELEKISRVCNKALPGAPHETWIVIDATTGQNAIAQANLFKNAVGLTGVILAKLDGTAKGGVTLGICNELRLPVRFVGIGESPEDLRPFVAEEFLSALYPSPDPGSAC